MDVTAADDTRCVDRVLLVADWSLDPHLVVAAGVRRAGRGDVRFAVVVPAALHGIDWVGDPYASRPCATRQLEALVRLFHATGLDVERFEVGDPDPTAAIADARAVYPATEIVLCMPARRLRHPLDLAHRVRRTTGLTVREVPARHPPAGARARMVGLLHGKGHCAADVPQAA